MAEDRQPDPSDDQPEEPQARAVPAGRDRRVEGAGPEPGVRRRADQPARGLFSSLAGGDMNALTSQLQSAFAMLGGAGSMFSAGTGRRGSGVNWEVAKDTARKTVASLGPDPSPDGGQQRALAEPSRWPSSGWTRRRPSRGSVPGRGLEPGRVDRADDAGLAAAGRAGRRRTSPTPWRGR